MTEDYAFTMNGKVGNKIVFGRSKLMMFADKLPHKEVHVIDLSTRRSLGYMPISEAKKKFI